MIRNPFKVRQINAEKTCADNEEDEENETKMKYVSVSEEISKR